MNKDNIAAHVQALATPEGRTVDTPGHIEALEYISNYLAGTELIPYSGNQFQVDYTRDNTTFTNILATLPGKNKALPPILMGAHYDAINDTPGADDNAAAVSILLDFGSLIPPETLNRSVILAFFDAEEPPFFLQQSMGSIRYYEDQRLEEIH